MVMCEFDSIFYIETNRLCPCSKCKGYDQKAMAVIRLFDQEKDLIN